MALKPIGGEIEAQVLNDNFSYLDERIGLYTETFEVLIPYDYPDLQSAVDHLSRFKASQGVRIVLKIASGHALTKGLLVENDDFGMFRIEAEDQEVFLDENFTGPAVEPYDEGGNLIVGVNARMPVLACIINMEGKGHAGYHATHSSNGFVEEGCGVKNAPFSGIEARSSYVYAYQTVFTGCMYGMRAQQGAVIAAHGSDCSESTSDGILASRGGTINFARGIAQNCGTFGARAQRSRLICLGADFTGAGHTGIRAHENSQIAATDAICNDAGTYGIIATKASSIDATRAICNNAGESGIYADEASVINAHFATCDNSNGTGMTAIRSSLINADGATARNANLIGILSNRGSTINANGADASGASENGFSVNRGSIISCRDGTGSLSQSANTLTAAGIIFQ